MKKEIYLSAIILLLLLPAYAQQLKTGAVLSINSTEICDNGIDDDGDGLIDINDPDCQCSQPLIPSLITNHSFETYTQCPTALKQLDRCTGWSDANTGSVDYMNTCSFIFQSITAAGLVPFPDGQGIAGGYFMETWKEYPGSCLQQPLIAGIPYQLTLNIASLPTLGGGYNCATCTVDYETVNITLYGTSDCANLPTTTVETVPGLSPNLANAQWSVIGTASYTPAKKWGQLTITFTPSANINAVAIGSPQNLPPTYATSSGQPYFIYDNLILNKASLFELNIQASGDFCPGNLLLTANPAVPVGSSATYQWYKDGIAINGATASSYAVSSNLSNTGEYKVRIMEGTGCLISTIYTVSSTLPSPQVTVIQPSCTVSTGNIVVTTPAPYYSFDNGVTWGSNPDSGALTEGYYRVKTRTSAGCVSTALVIHIVYTYLVPTYVAIQPSCGVNGTITITTPAVQYSFDNGATWSNSPTATNLPVGTYYIKTKDTAGCVYYSTFVQLYELPPAGPAYQAIQPTCSVSGTITITTAAAQYSFDNGNIWGSNPVAANLSPGYYVLVTKDTTGCVSNGIPVILDALPVISQPAYTVIQPTCTTGGSITITTTGTQYSFDGGATWGTLNTVTGLAAGNYNLAVKNNLGCISAFSFLHLNGYYIPAPAYLAIQPTCTNDGSITITTIAESYSFDGGINWSNNPTASDLETGYYDIRIKNSSGCISYSSFVFIIATTTLPNVPLVNVTQPVGCSLPTGTITIISTASQYSFDNGNSWTNSNVSSALNPGIYRIKIKDASGCQSPDTIVTINTAATAPPVPNIPAVISYCLHSATTPIDTGNNGNLLWYSSPTGGTGSSVSPTPASSSIGSTTYYVSSNSSGCESLRIPVTVVITPQPGAPFSVSPITYIQDEPTLPLEAIGTGLEWYDQQGNVISGTPVPDSSFPGTVNYYVGQSKGSCVSPLTEISVIVISRSLIITIPSYFTPNGDSFNEYWNIGSANGSLNGNTYIFDRYGKLLKSINTREPGWDGNYNGSPMPSSDYWFKSVYLENGIEKELTGHFSLKR